MTTDVRRVMLSLNIDANVKAATAGMDAVADSAGRMADSADKSSQRLLAVADNADSVATNAATLAGAFGDIAGGLDMVGLGEFSDELETSATALMLVAGVADVCAVATNALSVANIRARATTVAKTVAEKASAAASKAMAAAQWALNAAMSANPITLIVIAIAALVGGLVLAYKKSETFRNIVNAVGKAGQKAIGWVVDKVGDLVGWVRDKIPPAFTVAKNIAVKAFNLITLPARTIIKVVGDIVGWVRDKIPGAFNTAKDIAVKALQLITTPGRRLIEIVGDLVEKVRDKVGSAFEGAKNIAKTALDAFLSPIQAIIDLVESLIGWISKIKFPDPPDWVKKIPGIGGFTAPTTATAPTSSAAAGVTIDASVTINVPAGTLLNEVQLAQQLEQVQTRQRQRLGLMIGATA